MTGTTADGPRGQSEESKLEYGVSVTEDVPKTPPRSVHGFSVLKAFIAFEMLEQLTKRL